MILVAALVCGVILLRNVFVEGHQVLGWAMAAALVAMLLSPVVQRIDCHAPRPLAIALTFVLTASLGAGVTWLYSSSVLDQVAGLQESGPSIAQEIEDRDDRIGEIATEVGLVDQVSELTDRLTERMGNQTDVIVSVAVSAPPYFVGMILTIFLLLFGPRMISGALDQLSPTQRDRLRPALKEAVNRTQLYVWAAIVQGVVSGLVVWAIGSMLDVPAITLLAMFAALLGTLPYLGIVVGWLPMLVLALGGSSGFHVVFALLVAIGLQLVEVTWWRPVIDHRSLHVGPAIPIIVAVLGFGIYGIGGALYGCVITVFALAMLDQLDPGDRSLPTPVDDDTA